MATEGKKGTQGKKGMPALFDLRGHVALVTGGNSGIGLGLARGLAKAGANIAIWGRDPEKSAAAAKQLAELGTEVAAFRCEISDEAEVMTQTAAVVERFGRIDSCFANAGFGFPREFLDTSLEDWNAVINVNLTGVFLTFREVARHMVERGGGGKLVATSSIGSFHGMPRQQSYAASKGGLNALVRSIAVELGRHDIQANCLLPGWIETPATQPAIAFKKLYDTIVHRTPARRWGAPSDLEGVAVYLASEASRFHTGDTLVVDGGYVVF
jgi:NAD(P)-dependent dehydrogenase (short-subunit alcohol dehydrogenase family)